MVGGALSLSGIAPVVRDEKSHIRVNSVPALLS